MRAQIIFPIVYLLAVTSACRSPRVQCPPTPTSETAITLDQGWDANEQSCFYETSQGSQLVPYSWAIALERPQDDTMFLADTNIDELGFLSRGFDPSASDVSKRLPIGFVKDGNEDQLGFTCAACHTTQLEYRGRKLRIDGAGTLGDMPRLLHQLTASVERTLVDDAKLDRFIDRVIGKNHTRKQARDLTDKLTVYRGERQEYDRQNSADIVPGNGRLDAFGRIFNKALFVTEAGKDNFNPPDAPVSYPFLWGTDQSDYVQWVGFASNSNIGPLARNAGEVLGVFASVDIKSHEKRYPSSARMNNLIALEKWVRDLQAPLWREDILGSIDQAKAARGSVLYTQHCATCHNRVDRTDIDRKVVAWMENLNSIGTDPKTAQNIVTRKGKTGLLKGRKAAVIAGDTFLDEATAANITGNVVLGLLLDDLRADLKTEFTSIHENRGGADPNKKGNFRPNNPLNDEPNASLLAYKGRSLTGAWATAPFLHNGSVPNMWQLLTPESDRSKEFDLGSREFDPIKLGYPISQPKARFTFRVNKEDGTAIPGNSNKGHSGPAFGTNLTDQEKWDLIEYMKTEMNTL